MKTLAAHSAPVSAVHFSRDGTMLASSSHDGLVRLWDTASGHCLMTLVGPTKSPVMYVRFSPNGRYLLSSTLDGSIRLWDYMRNKCVKTYNADGQEFKFSSASVFVDVENSGRAVVLQGYETNKIGIWDVQSKQLVGELTEHTAPVLCVDVDPTGKRLVSAGMDGSVIMWEM